MSPFDAIQIPVGPYVFDTAMTGPTDVALGRTAAEATPDEVDGPYPFEVLDSVSHWIPEAAADDLLVHLRTHLAAHHTRAT